MLNNKSIRVRQIIKTTNDTSVPCTCTSPPPGVPSTTTSPEPPHEVLIVHQQAEQRFARVGVGSVDGVHVVPLARGVHQTGCLRTAQVLIWGRRRRYSGQVTSGRGTLVVKEKGIKENLQNGKSVWAIESQHALVEKRSAKWKVGVGYRIIEEHALVEKRSAMNISDPVHLHVPGRNPHTCLSPVENPTPAYPQ